MGCYYTKAELYKKVDDFKSFLGIGDSDYPVNLIEVCDKRVSLRIEAVPFGDPALRGMTVLPEEPGDADIILLNKSRSLREQNFDCGHEMMHLRLHRNEQKQTFNCFDGVGAHQNKFLEWQANEGSAEMLVPYRLILPKMASLRGNSYDWMDIYQLRADLSEDFGVCKQVIEYRFESLKYEIFQYINGVGLNDIEILSINQQKHQNIAVQSLNDIESESLSEYSISFASL